MSYTALYRKWRPTTFDDVKGQDHIVQTLKNQINADRIGHAYLFCGTRGTGKTTVAKIFARAVNCEHPVDGSPCNQCPTCQAIASGSSMNVVEIDAASNNGVENIREIRDEVQYSPTDGRYRVYIIDEVHMLSTGAFNALLKTLEEPPSYVIFILATTEVHKIPITVLSRCQRYDFKRISVDTITARLRQLTDAEHVEVEEKALRYVAKSGDGSMRDALSLLDQCIAFHYGEALTYDNVLEVLGAVDTAVFSELLRAVIENRTLDCIQKLEEVIIKGRELGQFVLDFTWYLRNLLILKSAGDAEEMLGLSAENLAFLREEAGMIDENTLMRYIRVFSELSNQMRYASQKRILIEMAFIKLTRPQMEQNLDSVLQRLSILEKKLEEGVVMAAAPAQAQASAPAIQEEEKPVKKVPVPKAQLEDLQAVRGDWGKIVNGVGRALRPALQDTVLEPAGEGRLCIVFMDENNYSIVNSGNRLAEIQDFVRQSRGKEITFTTRLQSGSDLAVTEYVSEEELTQAIHMNIEYED